jgi:hypothetical protein
VTDDSKFHLGYSQNQSLSWALFKQPKFWNNLSWINLTFINTINQLLQLGVRDYRRGMIWWMDLLTICIYHWELHFTEFTDKQRLVSSVYYNLQQSFPGNGFYRGTFFSFPHSGPPITAACAELLSTDNSTNWVSIWRPFHTNLLVFSSQADFQLNWQLNTLSLTNQLLHVTSLSWTADSSSLQLTRCFKLSCL